MSWGKANNSVLQPLNVLNSNILRLMTFSDYSCHVTPIHKNLNMLKLNDIYRLELAKFRHKLHLVRCPKYMTIFLKIFLMFILTKPDSLTTKIILYNESIQNLEKTIFYRGAAL